MAVEVRSVKALMTKLDSGPWGKSGTSRVMVSPKTDFIVAP